MATRKGDEDARGAERLGRGDDERPGVYVQVVGAPRKRKASGAKIAVDEQNSHSVERVGVRGRYHIERTQEESSDDTRPMERPVERTFAAPRRAHGPLGMEESPRDGVPTMARQDAPRSDPSSSLKKTSLGLGPRLDPELMVEARAREVAQEPVHKRVETPPYSFEASLPPSARQSSSPPREFEPPRAATPMRIVEVSTPAPPLAIENTNARADIVRAPAQEVVIHRDEREQLPSLLDARASIRPSDPVRGAQGPSWGMVVGVAVLSSIIASAGVVALQEVFRGGPREVPTSFATAPAESNTGAARSARAVEPKVVPAPAVAAPASTAPSVAAAVPSGAPMGAVEGALAAPVNAAPAATPAATTAAAGAPVAVAPVTAATVAPTQPVDTQAPTAAAPLAKPAAKPARVWVPRPAAARGVAGPHQAPTQTSDQAAEGQASPASRPRGGGNRILSDGLVAPERSSAPAESSEGLPTNPYE